MIPTLLLLTLPLQAPASGPELAWADVDRDGDQDALVILPSGAVRLLRNAGAAGFADATAGAGLAGLEGIRTARFADFDLDGAPDLALAGVDGLRLLRQVGGGAFEDATAGSGLEQLGAVASAEWIDADGDGRPDLHVLGRGGHQLWSNLAGGLFELRAFPESTGVPAPVLHSASEGAAGPAAAPPAARVEGPRPDAPAPSTTGAAATTPGAAALPLTQPLPRMQPPGGGAQNLAWCTTLISDYAQAVCLNASSVPTLGMLYPLSTDWFVDAASGYVGLGTTAPSARLHVENATGYALVVQQAGALALHVDEQGHVGVGPSDADTPLNVDGGTSATSSSGTGYVQIGASGTSSMGLDPQAIQTRSLSGPSLLRVNPDGGDVWVGDQQSLLGTLGRVGVGTLTPATRFTVEFGTEVTGAIGTGFVQVGGLTQNLAIDTDELQARLVTGAGVPLSLNPHGGDVRLGDSSSVVHVGASLGVGTGSPDVPLHAFWGADVTLAGGGYFEVGRSYTNNVVFDDNEIMARNNGAASTLYLNTEGGHMRLADAGWDVTTMADVGVGTTSPLADLHVEGGTTGDLLRVRAAGDTKLIVTNDGRVGVEGSNPSEKLDVLGNVRCVSVIETSDMRLKREVRELEGALEAVLALRGVSFEWDPAKYPAGDPGRKLGFLAQEVREVLPEAVKQAEDGYLSVSYSAVVPVLVEAVTEQQALLDEQRAHVDELLARVERLEAGAAR